MFLDWSFKKSKHMKIEKVNIDEKLNQITDLWSPHIIGELNGQHVKLTKLKGEFIWHKHDSEDAMFLVISGDVKIELRDKTISIQPGDFVIIPNAVMLT